MVWTPEGTLEVADTRTELNACSIEADRTSAQRQVLELDFELRQIDVGEAQDFCLRQGR